MAPPLSTFEQLALWDETRQPALYASLIALLVVNNLAAGGRFLAHYRTHYRHDWGFKVIFAEDYLVLLSALCINAVIGNLLAATYYGLGLHSWRINTEDAHYPRNLSNAFKHVWITMIFTGPTFAAIKLTLLFFYRRLFLINQKWLCIAWWANLIYIILWLFGATGFYIFQCWPVQWYFMQYYKKYDVEPPYPIEGQCNATSTVHVAIPLVFGLFSDVMILILPLATIFRLHMSRKAKIGLTLVFSVGIVACLLDLVRIVELWVDTDDKKDASYGVVNFLLLSAATEVAAIVCAALPIIGPQAVREYKSHRHTPYSYRLSSNPSGGTTSRSRPSNGFEELGSSHAVSSHTTVPVDAQCEHSQPVKAGTEGKIWVESEVQITIDRNRTGK